MPKIIVYIFGLNRNALWVKVNCWAILRLRTARAYQRGVRYLLIRCVTRPKKKLPAFTESLPSQLCWQDNLNHNNALHSLNPHFFKTNFNITLPPMPVFPMTSLAFRLSDWHTQGVLEQTDSFIFFICKHQATSQCSNNAMRLTMYRNWLTPSAILRFFKFSAKLSR